MKRLNEINPELDLNKYTPITRGGVWVSRLQRTENGWSGILNDDEEGEHWDAEGNALNGNRNNDIFLTRDIPQSLYVVMDDTKCTPVPVKGRIVFHSIAEIEETAKMDAEDLNIMRIHIY